MTNIESSFEVPEIKATFGNSYISTGEGSGISTWNSILDKPSTFPPSTHNHDDLYYTEDETDSLLDSKADTAHTHAVGDINNFASEVDARLVNVGKYALPYRIPSGEYFLTTVPLGAGYSAAGTSSTAVNSNNRGKFTPFYIAEPMSVDAMALHNVAGNAGAGACVRLGIYNDNNGKPGTVVIDAGTALINSPSLKTLTFTAVQLQAGFYWAVFVPQNLDTSGGNPTFSSVAGSATIADPAPVGSNNLFPIAFATIDGVLTDNPSVSYTRSTTGNVGHIWIRRA